MADASAHPAALSWSSSAGVRSPRDREAVLKLHRLRFVDKRGRDAALELIEEKRKEGQRQDAKLKHEHDKVVQGFRDGSDAKMRAMKLDGSFSYRSKEERDRMEAARQDPDEARDKITKHTQDLARNYRDAKAAIAERVAVIPELSLRTKEELHRWEKARQDPEEAMQATKMRRREESRRHQEEKRAMSARVSQLPRTTFWTRQQRERIEEARQDPDEALERMTKHMRETARNYDQVVQDMTAKVAAIPPMSLRSKEEIAAIEEARQDPAEALAAMKQHTKEVSESYQREQAARRARVQASPRRTFWTKAEREQIEERRQDPDEARQKAEQHMRELSQSYRREKQEMVSRVAAYPKKTFLEREHVDRMQYAAELRASQAKHGRTL